MVRRTNPIGLRIGRTFDWPSNLSHPFLEDYCRHIFQHFLVSKPSVKASLSEMTVSLTVLCQDGSILKHPKYINPVLVFNEVAHGEQRLTNITTKHRYYAQHFAKLSLKNLTQSQGLQLHHKQVKLHLNIINHPIHNADILAQYVANKLEQGKSLADIHKMILETI